MVMIEERKEEPLFDESPPIRDDDLLVLRAGLTDDQIKDARFYNNFRNGLMLVTGEAGEGKGVFTNMLAWKFKRYYPDCRAILDYLPRRAFGEYFLFNEKFIVEQIDKMSLVAKKEASNPDTSIETSKVSRWVSSQGEVYLRNTVWVMDEFRRYLNKRNPHNPMGRTLTDIFNIRRHLQTLIIGVTVKIGELDVKTCLPHVKYHTKVWRDSQAKHSYLVSIHNVRWSAFKEKLISISKYPVFKVNAIKERPEMGEKLDEIRHLTYNPKSDYYCWYDLFNSENAIALSVSRSLRKSVADSLRKEQ